jgi:HAE1 family hydrophobic/amphiphilic exporter-1
VFFPIVFVKGVAGQIFRDHALTVVFSLIASLVISLFLVPMLAARGAGFQGLRTAPRRHLAVLWSMPLALRNLIRAVRGIAGPSLRSRLAALFWLPFAILFALLQLGLEIPARMIAALAILIAGGALLVIRLAGRVLDPIARVLLVAPFNVIYAGMERAYPRFLMLALRARLGVVAICLFLIALAVFLLPQLGTDLVPEAHQGEFTIRLALPLGTPVERTDRVLEPLGDRILALPGVETTVMACGVARDEVADSDEGEHSARILVRLEEGLNRAEDEARTKARIRGLTADDPDLTSAPQFENPSLFATHTPVEVIIKGQSLETLRAVAGKVEAFLNGPDFPEVRDVRTNIRAGNPEVVIVFDRRKLVDLELSLETVAKRVRTALQGDVATRYNDRDRKVDMLVRLDESVQSSVGRLRRLIINPEEPFPRPLEDVAEVRRDTGPAEIFRVDQQRAALVRANVEGIDLGRISERIERQLRRIEAEESTVVTEVSGQNAEMKAATRSMVMALLLALFLVYVVMASQFENLLHPFVILLTFPLATVGVVPILYVLGIRLSVVVGIGAIMLSGIVVNDAIVLVDYVNRLRRRGLDRREALLEAGKVRLRPIMMTTMTTILGLIPLTGALPFLPGFGAGEGVELRAPMAITVIAGLASATVLTLVVIPVVYDLLDLRLGRETASAPAAKEQPA